MKVQMLLFKLSSVDKVDVDSGIVQQLTLEYNSMDCTWQISIPLLMGAAGIRYSAVT